MDSRPLSSLAATRVAAADRTPRTIVMLHGIYGRGRNWQGIARALTARRPEYACWLVDLPHHGASGPGRHGDSVRGLAADLEDWTAARSVRPDAVLGHSYGGKVALAYAARRAVRPLQVWVIDASPDARPAAGTAWAMLELVRRLPPRFASRDDAVEAIVAGGYPLGVARWMATNLVRCDGAFVWQLDVTVMEGLLRDFFATDLWPIVEGGDADLEVHVLKAASSTAISDAAVRRLVAAGRRVHLHVRDGGHWIHAESPGVVVDLLARHLP